MNEQNSCKTLIQLHLTTVTFLRDSVSLSIDRSAYVEYNAMILPREREVGAHIIYSQAAGRSTSHETTS